MDTRLISSFSNAVIVNQLICAALKAIPHLSDDEEAKRDLIRAVAVFESAIAPSAISLDEIKECMALHGLVADDNVALELLIKAALNIDLNYVSQAIEYQVDEYRPSQLEKQR